MAYLPPLNGGRINVTMSGNTSGGGALVSSGTLVLVGGNNMTLSQNVSTISISAGKLGGSATLKRWEAPEDVFGPLALPGQGSLSIQHVYVPYNVTGTAMKVGASIDCSTQFLGIGGNGGASMSLWMGIYTLNGSTLQTVSTGSANNAFTWDGGNNAALNSSVNSMRQFTVPMNVNMTAGEYWVGAVISNSIANQNMGVTMYGNNQVATAASGAIMAPIGSSITAGSGAIMFQGIHKTASVSGPASIQGSQINNSSASFVQLADFYFAIYSATY